MKLIKSLFLLGFIVLHNKVGGAAIFIQLDHLVAVSENKIHNSANIYIINNPEGFIVKESFDEVTNMIALSNK